MQVVAVEAMMRLHPLIYPASARRRKADTELLLPNLANLNARYAVLFPSYRG